jgi:hypothetical protein
MNLGTECFSWPKAGTAGTQQARSDHTQVKWIKGLSSALAGQLLQQFVIILPASCVSLGIRHRKSQRYNRDLTCATDNRAITVLE